MVVTSSACTIASCPSASATAWTPYPDEGERAQQPPPLGDQVQVTPHPPEPLAHAQGTLLLQGRRQGEEEGRNQG